jgi:Zn-dependent protease
MACFRVLELCSAQSQKTTKFGDNLFDTMTTDATPAENESIATAPVDLPEIEEGRRILLPAVLFVATCLSTFWSAAANWNPSGYLIAVYSMTVNWAHTGSKVGLMQILGQMNWRAGWFYMVVVLAILLSHEMGHFLMTLRHRVPASLPYFIPLPIVPFGTLGAVIGMDGSKATRRELFDLGIAGPLAGFAVSLPILWIGILQLPPNPIPGHTFCFHNPLLLQYLIAWLRPSYAAADSLYLNQFNPCLMAAWVGLLITGLNMLPISQLDGGHVIFALLGRRSHLFARALLVIAIAYYALVAECYPWILMLVLVILLGADHPPTADDDCELGFWRRAIGWTSLIIPILCFPVRGITPPGW